MADHFKVAPCKNHNFPYPAASYKMMFQIFCGDCSDFPHFRLLIRVLVVTGATDGIGKAYAYELARKGFNIFLISRTQSKLDEIQKDIREKYNKVDVKTFAFDFCAGSAGAYKPLIEALNSVEVGVLVNNVGMSYEYPESLHKVEGGLERIGAIATINTLPPTIVEVMKLIPTAIINTVLTKFSVATRQAALRKKAKSQ
ncbi:oxidoreductase, short chain dehydrogenase/reductase family protein [Ancylostoma ceylanicum]|uniref:Oxidoreductase, short chain dehydrogenase/reductase family protein n=1 Tax=Ancylostoma ceylanicum TaxID=53326 RepID=A0A0D6LXZ5_9BILA|nr:oxidoreductase, short chain dehydrogenase/reductase family protein [Ancylostoma ceylanicum]